MQGSIGATGVKGLDSSTFNVSHLTPDQRLYKGILLTAVLDASGRTTGTNSPHTAAQAKEEALQWFETAGPDFVEVCDLAGFEPELVRSKVKAYLAKVGDIKSNSNTASIAAAADRANVSGGTVSRVLANSASVLPSTRQRVKEAIAALQCQSCGSRVNV